MGSRGEPVRDESLLLLFNAHHEPLPFTIPAPEFGEVWEVLVNTAQWEVDEPRPQHKAKATVDVDARTSLLLVRVTN
jgi:glycogen operon protein